MTQPVPENISVPPSAQALAEAEALSGEILRDIELSQIPLSLVVLKALRLARIVNDFEGQQVFEWESGGYPRGAKGVTSEVWAAAARANRVFYWRKSTQVELKLHMYRASIEELENVKEMGSISLEAARDPDVSLSSANQRQFLGAPRGNASERQKLRTRIETSSQRLASRRTFIYNYASRKHYELKFGSVADNVFARIRDSVDGLIGELVPDAVKKFTAIYDNLKSGNPEDWANAVHGCRRVLQDLADAVFPAQNEPRSVVFDGKTKSIELGKDQYINRLIAFIGDSSESRRFSELVGSELEYIGNRLDALFKASQKGSHATVRKEEADRYVVYTYLTVGDILSLRTPHATAEDSYNEDSYDEELGDSEFVIEPIAQP